MCMRVVCEKDARANARGFRVNRCVGAHGNLCRDSEKESVCVCLNSLAQNCHLPLTLAGREGANEERGENEQEEEKKGLRRENN